MQRDQILDAYDRVRPALAEHSDSLRRALERWLADHPAPGPKVHSVSARLKDPASLADKLARPDKTYRHLWEVTDLLGLRVITYFDDDVDRVGRLVERHLPVDFLHSVDKRAHRDPREAVRFGYRSLHYVCRIPGADLQSDPDAPAPRFEIQVRTLLSHAWAEIEHDLGYKARDAMPAPVRRRLHRLAGLLELADQEFAAIRAELSDYAATLPARLAAAELVPLDRLSLEGLLDLPECRTLDLRIAERLAKPLGETPFYPDYLLRMVNAAGFTSANELRAGLARHEATILALVTPYFAFTTATWGLSPATMDAVLRGYALFFLSHAELLADPRPGQGHLHLDTVTRLTNFYRELDYPHDEREAQRVAGLLFDHLRRAGLA